METKNLTVLALIGVVVLTGALIVSVSGKFGGMEGGPVAQSYEPGKARPPSGTMTGSSAQTSVEVLADNVQTSVEVQ